MSLLPPDMSAAVFSFLVAASFVASFITIAFGIGGGAVTLAVMASLLPPTALIPVHGIVQFGSNVFRALTTLRFVSWATVPAFLVGSLVGVGIGGVVAINIPPAMVQVGVGLFIIWSVFATPPRWMRRWAGVTGAISSFLTMFFGATGSFVAAYTKSLKLDRYGYVGTHATLMTIQHVLKTITFGLLGFAFGPWMALVVGMIAAGFAGTLAGRLVLNRISDRRFHLALNAILLVVAGRLIWAGLTG